MLSLQPHPQTDHNTKFIESLPSQFIKFLKTKHIDVQQLTIQIPRYIRIKPHANVKIDEICSSLAIDESSIVQISQQFYALAHQVKISGSKLYENGLIYGMDYSSAMPVRCLDLQSGMHVLELCSAPGNKSMYMADLVEDIHIVGVQINPNRANIMKNLIQKYKLGHKIQVKLEDAVTFKSQIKFDRVLVDAECTHEGSIKHIKKFMSAANNKQNKNQVKAQKKLTKQQEKQLEINSSNSYTSERTKANQWTEADFNERFLDEKKLNNLADLQYNLICNGFKQLKDGGILVYSTCSFDQTQNEGIVQKLLTSQQDAQIMDCSESLYCELPYENGRIKQCLHFKPSISRCGGMFVSKVRKLTKKKITEQIIDFL